MSNKVAFIEHSLCLQHISHLPVKYTNTTCSFSRTYQLIAIHVTLFGYYKQTTPINSSEKRVHDLYLGKDSCKKECFLSGIARKRGREVLARFFWPFFHHVTVLYILKSICVYLLVIFNTKIIKSTKIIITIITTIYIDYCRHHCYMVL